MSTDQETYISKGKREPTAGLVQQAQYTLGLWDAFKQDLQLHGFAEVRATAMRDLLSQLRSAAGTQTESWTGAQAKTRAEAIAISNAKAFTFTLWNALPMALREASNSGLSEADFAAQGRVRRSTPRILNHLDKIRPHVAKLEPQLKPYFKGESPVSLLDNLRAALASADQSQELARAQAPDSTALLNETKGRLLETIEDLNRVGAIAFFGRADVSARFNKDLLLRARRSKTGTAEPTPEPAPA